jgi:hypothetical protein
LQSSAGFWLSFVATAVLRRPVLGVRLARKFKGFANAAVDHGAADARRLAASFGRIAHRSTCQCRRNSGVWPGVTARGSWPAPGRGHCTDGHGWSPQRLRAAILDHA